MGALLKHWKERLALSLLGVAAVAPSADAGAWVPERGDGQMILSLAREAGDFGVTWRADDYLEYGVGGGWALNLKLENQIRTRDGFDDRFGGRVGVQRSFMVGERMSVGVQAALLGGEALEGPVCAGTGVEARAMAGLSFPLGGRDAFVNVEAGVRERDGCSRTLAEVAAGVDLGGDWRALGKAWSENGDRAHSTKAEIGLLRDIGRISLGLGYRAEVSGDFNEDGVVAMFWTRF